MADVKNARRCDVCKKIYEDGHGEGEGFGRIRIDGDVFEDFCPDCEKKVTDLIKQLVKFGGNAIVLRGKE